MLFRSEKERANKKEGKKPMSNQANFTRVKKRNSFKPKGGKNNKGRGNYYTLLDNLESSTLEEDFDEDIEEIVLETQVDLSRLAQEEEMLDQEKTKLRVQDPQPSKSEDMIIQKDLKRPIHLTKGKEAEGALSSKKNNNKHKGHK